MIAIVPPTIHKIIVSWKYNDTQSTLPPESHSSSVLFFLARHKENQDYHETDGSEGQNKYNSFWCLQGKLFLSITIMEVLGVGLEEQFLDSIVWVTAANKKSHRLQTYTQDVVWSGNQSKKTLGIVDIQEW